MPLWSCRSSPSQLWDPPGGLPPPQAELFVDSVEPVVEKAVKDITGSFDFGDTDKVSITFEQYCEIDDGELNTGARQ